ncbi:carbohydrate ABC transporter permease [Actinophytocola sediminis]
MTARPAVTTRQAPVRTARLPMLVLLIGAAYCLLPVAWVVVAATKGSAELFSTSTFLPGTQLLDNITGLFAYRDGLFLRWAANTALYAGLGAALSALLSGMTGYALAKYVFPGRTLIFNVLLAGVLVPGVVLAVPQYLLLAEVGLADTYASVLLPSIVSPFGIYLARVYAAAAVPDSVIEVARTDGAGEFRIFVAVAMPMMVPGLVTVFLFQFVAIWNNFLLPFLMLGDDRKFPLTVGLVTMLDQGTYQPALYHLVITGALLAVLPLVALFLSLQRYWRIDLMTGAMKG